MDNINKVETNVLSKPGLVTDLDNSYLNKEVYTHARNGVVSTHEGNIGTISSEKNSFCIETSYPIIGHISLQDNKFVIFSTDNITSEIGVLDESKCTYEKYYSSTTLGFNTNMPIIGVSKKDFNQKTKIVFGNKNLPTRIVELEKLKSLTKEDETLLFKIINHPCISVSKQTIGNLPNGVYAFAIAYIVDGQRYSDYYSLTGRYQIYSVSGRGGSLELTISDLDEEFKEYEIVAVGNVNGVVTAERVGIYSTSIKNIIFSDFLKPQRLDIDLSELVVKKPTWLSAGIITSNSNYLLLADLVGREEYSYQRKAMEIKTKYVVKQVPLEYYEGISEDVGYYRDEVYDFYIEGIYKTGESTKKFHIGGRKATGFDMSLAVGEDAIELEETEECDKPTKLYRWQVENTAGDMKPENEQFVCNQRILGRGDMAYFQSTELYPDNEYLFGENANKPIRYHKFPDECKVPRYSVINGRIYINILGVEFSNIQDFDDSDIIGYKITRSQRDKTIIARGLFTNVRGYYDEQNKSDVLYTNYPVNPYNPDLYLSTKQTVFKNNREKNYNAPSTIYKNKFNFYTPHAYFNEKYIFGNEVKFESEEIGTIKGNFEDVYGHPKHKLLSQLAFWVASVVGALEYYLTIQGKISITTGAKAPGIDSVAGDAGSFATTEIKTVEDLLMINIPQLVKHTVDAVKNLDVGSITSILNMISSILAVLTSLGLKLTYGAVMASVAANEIIDSIQRFLGFTQYAKQFNGVATFTESKCIEPGKKRRRTQYQPSYLSSDVHLIRDFIYNNFRREDVTFFELTKDGPDQSVKDESQFTIGSAGICDSTDSTVTRTVSAFYGTSKVVKPNQYGSLGSFYPCVMHSCVLTGSKTPVLFGGDCIIGRLQIMKKMNFFAQDLATTFGNELPPEYNENNINLTAGVEYNYRLYRNIAYARYWIDSTKYDYSQIFRKNVVNKSSFSRTTTSKYNLDCKANDGENIFRVDNSYFYLSNNCVLDFIVEADYNINFREIGDNRHYSKNNTNLSLLYRPQFAQFNEKFELSRSYYNLNSTEIYNEQVRKDLTPETAFSTNQPNSIIYSLPSFNMQSVDNWRYFLPGNFFSFREGDFGTLTGIHKVDQDSLIFTFTEASPYIMPGQDILQFDGTNRKVIIGDGGLFANDPRESVPTETSHGGTTSRYAFKNTHLGRYYPSVDSRKIFAYGGRELKDITEQGMHYWCNNYMPLMLLDYFPEYTNIDNIISGIGYGMVMDSVLELIYIIKRDFVPLYDNIILENDKFSYNGLEISLRDEKYFKDVSWTLSYSPRGQAFVSFHDWHPDWIIQTNNHFLTVKDNTVWKHNESYDGFCNFYGKQYPFEVEFVSSGGQSVEIVKSLEYILEVSEYKNKGRNKFHILNENFDKLIVSNTEQASPLLTLVKSTQNPYENIKYPIKTGDGFDILYGKEENKYRINQFWDSIKDRGEFTSANTHIFYTDESGYRRIINPLAVDLDKPETQWKKFRHYWNKFWFAKENPIYEFVIKLFNVKKTISPR